MTQQHGIISIIFIQNKVKVVQDETTQATYVFSKLKPISNYKAKTELQDPNSYLETKVVCQAEQGRSCKMLPLLPKQFT